MSFCKPSVGLALTFAAFVAGERSAHAQGNYRSTPIGGRSALLGDTGVALGSDGSSPFLNPATIVRIHDANLAFSVNFFSFTDTHFGAWHKPGPVDTSRYGNPSFADASTSTTRFDLFPSTFCLFFTVAGWGDPHDAAVPLAMRHAIAPRTGRQKLAVCLGTTEKQDLELPAVNFRAAVPGGSTQTAQSVAYSWRRVALGPSYGIDLTDALTVGVSLHAVFTSYGFQWSSSAVTSDAAGAPTATSLDASGNGHSIDLDGVLGATYEVGALTFGLAIAPPALHLSGSYDASFHQQTSVTGNQGAMLAGASGSFRAPPPAHVGVGVGGALGSARLEVDTTYFFPRSDAVATDLHVDAASVTNGVASTSSSETAFAVRARPVVDVAMGAEVFVAPKLSVLGGVSTDVSSVPQLAAGALSTSIGTFYEPRVHRVALATGIGSYGEAGTILVGTQLSVGWGQVLTVDPYVVPNTWAAVDARTYGAMLIVAGSMNLRALRGAFESVKDVVTKHAPTAPPTQPTRPTPLP